MEELVRWNEEGVLLQHPANDHDRMGAQDIHCDRRHFSRAHLDRYVI
jgi:hypothetical protein